MSRVIGRCCGRTQDSICNYCGADVDPVGKGKPPREFSVYYPKPFPTSVPGPGALPPRKASRNWGEDPLLLVLCFCAFMAAAIFLSLSLATP